MKSSYTIRDYREGDEQGITDLFCEVFGKEMTMEQWRWKYLFPGNGKIYSKIAEDAFNKRIVGHAGAIPLRGVFKDRPIQFFQIVDVMVHPMARGFLGSKNVFNMLIKTLLEDIGKKFPEAFCYGFPGTRPFLLGKRVGVYDKIEQAIDCTKDLRRHLFLNPYRVKKLRWDDNRLDILWAGLSRDFPLSLIRDKDYLYWRYATNPFFSYYLLGFFIFRKLIGWAVIRDVGDEVLVVDLFTKLKCCRNILRKLENYLTSLGKRKIRLWLPQMWRKKLKDYNLQETNVVTANMVWKLPFKTHIVKANLYYTMGDVDIF